MQEWAELDSERISIGGDQVSALHAAKECAEREVEHGWLPDKLDPGSDPPLTETELQELCVLLNQVSHQDRISCTQSLPPLGDLQSPTHVSRTLTDLRSATARADETEELRSDWDEKLQAAQTATLQVAVSTLEAALTDYRQIQEDWQHQILDLVVSDDSHKAFWRSFIKTCSGLRDQAFRSFEKHHGFQIDGVSALDPDPDWMEPLMFLK